MSTALHPPRPVLSQAHYSTALPLDNSRSSTFRSRPSGSRHSSDHAAAATAGYETVRPSQLQMQRQRPDRKTDWAEFYRNGIPREVIVIDDSSPEPASLENGTRLHMPLHAASTRQSDGHVDKKQRTSGVTAPHADAATLRTRHPPEYDDSLSEGSTRRTNSGQYSTAPTSLASTSSSGGRVSKLDDTRPGQKRKRLRGDDAQATPDLEVIAQNHSWSNYYPPPNPPIKAQEVFVSVVRDKASASTQNIDDDDGHYIVTADTDLTDRYGIVKLLGQGTFGKVVEAYDRKKKTKCAVKIIRAVQKYRDASRIELRVLSTLAANDKQNRNRCIHLRDCFDFRNHICIVTDLLGSSVFDFLKANQFVPFPSTHIQSFARQLFTSVAFLHDLNLIHTDLKPENILLVSNGYQTFTYNKNIPSSSRATQRNAKYRKVLLDPEIRLIDFGSATFDDEYHSSVVSTRHYRAPEIILNLGWSFPCDIWSIGCILVEFFTGDALFQTHDNLEHLAMMEAVCNSRIDREIIAQVRQTSRSSNKGNNNPALYFRPRAFQLDYPNNDTPRTSKKFVKNMKRLDETIPPTTEFNQCFLDLLRRIFVYDPAKRITAKQALAHPWFEQTLQDDGTEALKIRLSKQAAGKTNGTSAR